MNKKKLLILILITLVSFCLGTNKIFALTSSGDCSAYFTYNDVIYNEGNNGGFVDNVYGKESSNAKIFVGDTSKGETYHGDVEDEIVTSAWYFSACNDLQCPYGYNKKKLIESNMKLIIDVYKKDSNTKLCSWSLTGFDASKSRVKVRLQHQGTIENITMKGYFTFGNNSTNMSEVSIVLNNTTTEFNTEKGTKKGAIKNMDIITDENGKIISSASNDSCTDVKTIIHDYWKYVMVLVPILLIVLMTVDFFKAMASNDADAIKKSVNNTTKRVIAAVILLALPALLSYILGIFGLPLCI